MNLRKIIDIINADGVKECSQKPSGIVPFGRNMQVVHVGISNRGITHVPLADNCI